MSVTTVSYTMEVPKELMEVIDLLDGILEKVMTKADVATYIELLDEASAAAGGIQNVAEEAKSQYRDEAAAYLVHKIMGRLLPAS